jgi:hypothetical protein
MKKKGKFKEGIRRIKRKRRCTKRMKTFKRREVVGAHDKETGISFMEHSPSSESNNQSPVQKISRPLWNPRVHHRFHKTPPLVHILRKINSVHTLPPYFYKIHSNIILRSTRSLFSKGFQTKILYTILISPRALHDPSISSSFIWSS